MITVTIYQTRSDSGRIERKILGIPDGLMPKVSTYIYHVGGWHILDTSHYKCYEVVSPMMLSIVKTIKAMGNVKDGYVEEFEKGIL